MSELTFVNVQIPIETNDELRKIAAEKRTSRSDIVRDAIAEYIRRYLQTKPTLEQTVTEKA